MSFHGIHFYVKPQLFRLLSKRTIRKSVIRTKVKLPLVHFLDESNEEVHCGDRVLRLQRGQRLLRGLRAGSVSNHAGLDPGTYCVQIHSVCRAIASIHL